jgi:hypothetical protein
VNCEQGRERIWRRPDYAEHSHQVDCAQAQLVTGAYRNLITFLRAQTEEATQNRKFVIPRAGFARGICFFLLVAKKQIPRFAQDDN